MELTKDQSSALSEIVKWLGAADKPIGILTGKAGTGKTTMIRSITDHLSSRKMSYRLLAPTGRAARILEKKVGEPAHTIHAEIYELEKIEFDDDETGQEEIDLRDVRIPFRLKEETFEKSMVFIVDEASMVSDVSGASEVLQFGSGRLLWDMLRYAGIIRGLKPKARILFVGDTAQLPPIRSEDSPALLRRYFNVTFGVDAQEFLLTNVLRHEGGSPILENAQAIRSSIERGVYDQFGYIVDGHCVINTTISDAVSSHVQDGEYESRVIITYTNKSAHWLNTTIRKRRFGWKASVQTGDILLVVKNSLLFSNGDLLYVVNAGPEAECRSVKIKSIEEPVMIIYRDIIVRPVEYRGADKNQSCKIVENLLSSSKTYLSREEVFSQFVDFRRRYGKLSTESDEFRLEYIKDRYLNAIHVKYGYAITCHKAQGGEWPNVTINFDRVTKDSNFFRWAYTATTRAVDTLKLINPPVFGEPRKQALRSNIDDIDNSELIRVFRDRLNNGSVEFRSMVEKEFGALLDEDLVESDRSATSYVQKTVVDALMNRGTSWTVAEDERIRKEFVDDMPIPEIAAIHGRTEGAIRSRLVKLGLLVSKGDNGKYLF